MRTGLRSGLLVSALLLVAAGLGFSPSSATTLICECVDGPFQTQFWASGRTCEEAHNNVPSACRAAANMFCQSIGYDAACALVCRIDSVCWYDGTGRWVVEGTANHSCRLCYY